MPSLLQYGRQPRPPHDRRGNFANFGRVDFYVAANQVVDLTFNTTANSSITGIGTWDLNNVPLLKLVLPPPR